MERYHIIAADDDELFLFVIRHALLHRFPGADITTVRSADDALVAYELLGADMVVTDYHMPPGPTGLELVRALRACGAAVPVAVISSDDRVEQDVRSAGAALFLSKGVALDELTRALAPLLQRSPKRASWLEVGA